MCVCVRVCVCVCVCMHVIVVSWARAVCLIYIHMPLRPTVFGAHVRRTMRAHDTTEQPLPWQMQSSSSQELHIESTTVFIEKLIVGLIS